jgi:hypothetical protein
MIFRFGYPWQYNSNFQMICILQKRNWYVTCFVDKNSIPHKNNDAFLAKVLYLSCSCTKRRQMHLPASFMQNY